MPPSRGTCAPFGEWGTALSLSAGRRRRPFAGPAWRGALIALLLAIGAGVLVAEVLISPTNDELLELAGYLAASAAATVWIGSLVLRLADRAPGLSISRKVALASTAATGIALLNVFIVAQLMFISTGHDLPLLVALLVFSGATSVAFALLVTAAVGGRLERIAGAVRTLAGGDYSVRLAADGSDEVGRLAADVNQLAARLAQAQAEQATLERERRELTAAISHDLRTPLASIRAVVEALDDGLVDDPAEVRRYFATARREVARLDALIADLFDLARLDAGALPLERRPIDPVEIVTEVVEAFQPQAHQRGVDVAAQVDGPAFPLPLDGALVERALSNLVRNALHHTERGGAVQLRLATDGPDAVIEVADTGHGIDPDLLPHVWDRFARGDASRSPGGAGLGLAIVRSIVEAHGGHAEIASRPGEGTTVRLYLPHRA